MQCMHPLSPIYTSNSMKVKVKHHLRAPIHLRSSSRMDDMSGMLLHHLTCPISLQPMQDPVTAPTGITYDRRAIERWLAAGHPTCPVTGQPLALADLTPNLTLRRLIQSWRTTVSAPEAGDKLADEQRRPPQVATADEVIKKLMLCTTAAASSPPPAVVDVLREAAEVASQSDAARRRMVDAGVLHRVLRLLLILPTVGVKCPAAADQETETMLIGVVVEAGLDLVRALAVSADDEMLVADRHVHDLLDAVTDLLVSLDERTTTAGGRCDTARASAVRLLDTVLEAAAAGSGSAVLERLRPALFRAVTGVVRARVTPVATRSALRVLLHACPLPRNRALLVDAGAAHEAIELLLDAAPPRATTTELCMAVLAEVTSGCAEGRAAVAAHAAGVAVVARRLLMPLRGRGSSSSSAWVDACAVKVLAAVAGRGACPETLREMARVGAVGKLCCVLQADCDAGVRDVARGVLRMHAGAWSGSPCVSAYLLSRYL